MSNETSGHYLGYRDDQVRLFTEFKPVKPDF